MFENLSEKLNQTFKRLKGHGKLSEQNIQDALKEVRITLLEADVNFKVVKEFIEGVKHIPLVLDDKFQELKKNKEVVATLGALGLEQELSRCSETKTRAGRGKTRGRRTIRKKGPLIVISEDKGIVNAARNIAGVDISDIKCLEVGSLAPGTTPGRLTIWTKSAAAAADKLAGG